MLPLRYPQRWRAAGVCILVVALVVTLLPAFWPQVSIGNRLPLDKLMHAAAFAMLAVWFSGQYSPRSYWKVATGLVLFGGLIELCQLLTGYRSGEWKDLLADTVGIVGGIVVAMLGPGGWSLRFERWLAGFKDRMPDA